jgi:hypothetical protein
MTEEPSRYQKMRALLQRLADVDITAPNIPRPALDDFVVLRSEAKELLESGVDGMARAHEMAAKVRLEEAIQRDQLALPTIKQMLAQNASLRQIAQALDGKRIPSPGGSSNWNISTIRTVMRRHNLSPAQKQAAS